MPNPVQPRYHDFSDTGLPNLTDKELKGLNEELVTFLDRSLGIILDPDKNAPMSDGSIPRMMILRYRVGDNDSRQNLNSTVFRPGTMEFYQQVMMGNIFAYPVGKAKPVQLQIGRVKGEPVMRISDPVEPEQIPVAPAKAPSWFQTLLHYGTFGLAFRSKCRAWSRAQKDHSNLVDQFKRDVQRRERIVKAEKREYDMEKEKAAMQSALESEKKEVEKLANGKRHFLETFQPVPVKREDMIKRHFGHPAGEHYGFYTEDHFRNLTILTKNKASEDKIREALRQQDDAIEQKMLEELRKQGKPIPPNHALHPDQQAEGAQYKFRYFDQDAIKIGGQSLTNAQFAAVTLATCYRSDYQMAGQRMDKNAFDPTLETAFVNAGYSKEDAALLSTANDRSMGTTDLFINPPRDNSGTRIKPMVDPARLETAKAFESYQAGVLNPLAKLIANGVNLIAMDFVDLEDKIGDQVRGSIVAGEELVGMLDADPKLKQAAAENGMNPDKLESLRGMIKVQKLEQKAKEARYQIVKAWNEGNPPTKEQKEEYATQIVTAKLAMLQLKAHTRAFENDPNSAFGRFMTNVQFQNPEEVKVQGGGTHVVPKSERPAPEPGKFYSDTTQQALIGVKMLYHPEPAFLRQLNAPRGEEKLKEFASNIVQEKNLANLSTMELYNQLKQNGKLNLTDSLERLNENMKPDAPVRPQYHLHRERSNSVELPAHQSQM